MATSISETFDAVQLRFTTIETSTIPDIGMRVSALESPVLKEFSYKALLTQNGTAVPVSRVLNAGEYDFLSGVVITREGVGITKFTNATAFDKSLIQVIIGETGVSPFIYEIDYSGSPNYFLLTTKTVAGVAADVLLSNTPISISSKVRGFSPNVVAIETNEAGDKIFVEFDKVMNDYFIPLVEGDFLDSLTHTFTIARDTDTTKLVLTPDSPYLVGETINLSYGGNTNLEALDLGLADAFAVDAVNNTPYLMTAITNESGAKVILTFNRPMASVAHPTNIKLTDALAAEIPFTSVNLGASPNDSIEVNLTTPVTGEVVITLNIDGVEGVMTAEDTVVLVSNKAVLNIVPIPES
jgi:hypothetical protein